MRAHFKRAWQWIAATLAVASLAPALAAKQPSAQRVFDTTLSGAAMAVVDGRLWVASRGGGLIGFERGARSMRFDLGRGLPSAVAHDVAALPDGRLLVATERGLVLVDPDSGSSKPVTPPGAGAPNVAADLVLAATRGSSAIFQLTQADAGDAGSGPGASLWHWDGQRVKAWDPQLGPGLVATVGMVDRDKGCFHVAGIQAHGPAQVPWVARQCGDQLRQWRLAEGAPNGTIGVAAIARAPDGRSTVLVLVTQPSANSASRRHVVMTVTEDGRLSPHCSNASFQEPVTGLVQSGAELVVARLGAGVHTLSCGPPRPLTDDARLRYATALAQDPRLGLLVATDTAVWQLPNNGPPVALTPALEPRIPVDALPMQAKADGKLVLLSSPTVGPLELARPLDRWQLASQWRAGIELPGGVYGPAAYAERDQIVAVQLSQGLLRLQQGRAQALELHKGALPLEVASTSGGLWIATGTTPFDGTGAGLHFLGDDGSKRFAPLPGRQAQPSGRLMVWPDGRVWAGTRLGVVEADTAGIVRRVSGDRVEALYHNASRGIVGAVGATVQRWDGERMVPVLFAIEPRPPRPLGHPVDLVIDDAGRWLILYSGGQLVILDEERRFVATLDERAGIAPSSRRLLYLPTSGELMIGSAREGVFSLRLP